MKHFLLMLVFALFQSSAFAQLQAAGLPQELPSNAPTYAEIFTAWEKGVPATESVLTGKWIQTGQFGSANCQSRPYYDKNGLTSEGELWTVYTFGRVTIPRDDFLGKPSTSYFVVQPTGAAHGPISPGQVSPTPPHFSYWLSINKKIETGAYREMTCHLVPNSVDKMICAVKFILLDKQKFSFPKFCEKDPYTYFETFIKK